ncbi:MAG: hypothetical protein ABI718_04880 [Acidobacteriota bacterium]
MRWPFPMALETLRGGGANDATALAFVAPFFVTLAAFVGYLRAVWLGRAAGSLPRGPRLWLQVSVSGVIVAAALTALFTGMTFFRIRETLPSSLAIVWWLLPPVLTLALAIGLRYEIDENRNRENRAADREGATVREWN